jgi:tetratricopeptide (TPR) repeat protein
MADPKEEIKQTISPAKRKILQQQFEHGSKSAAKGDFDYACEMFSKCVAGDPGNVIYVQNFLGNLFRKYNNNKTGAKMASIRGAGAKGSMKKAAMQKNWHGVIEAGLEFLKLNPWDVPTLSALADACDHLEFDQCRVAYLRAALDADIKDPETNRLLGRALDKVGDYDGAIRCWQRVLAAKALDDEARKGVANAQVKRTIEGAGYDHAETSTDVMADKQAQAERLGQAGPQISPEQILERAIKKNPEDVSKYIELADLHTRHERYDQAEQVLLKALEVSGGALHVREQLEDARLRKLREQVSIAEKRAAADQTDDARALLRKYREELNHVELEIYRNRCDRYPSNLAYKYELGVRLQRAGQASEAIKILQEARADPQRKGEVLLALGECFQQIKQFKLAVSNYEQALEAIAERNVELKKRALYRAGSLALNLKNLEAAESWLTMLAGIDFTYRDVPELLDKIRRLREETEQTG